MKIGIICAAEKELAPFLPQIEAIKISEKAMLEFYEGQIHGTEVAAVVSGVCKVNAAVAAQILIDGFGVRPSSIPAPPGEWTQVSGYMILS